MALACPPGRSRCESRPAPPNELHPLRRLFDGRNEQFALRGGRPHSTFLPGGIISGVVIIRPDFPELNDNWPFLRYENEYVVDTATTSILLANAAESLSR